MCILTLRFVWKISLPSLCSSQNDLSYRGDDVARIEPESPETSPAVHNTTNRSLCCDLGASSSRNKAESSPQRGLAVGPQGRAKLAPSRQRAAGALPPLPSCPTG